MCDNDTSTEKENEPNECVSDETDAKECCPFEVNTYDAIPVRSNISKGQSGGILKKCYSILAVLIVLISVIFSSAELLDVIIDDMGAGNTIIKRIFGSNVSGDDLHLYDLIIYNSFLSFNDRESIREESLPKATLPPVVSPPSVPIETDAPTKPLESSKEPEESVPSPESSPPPESNRFPILPMDMSLLSYGEHYIYNDTSLSPDIGALSKAKLKNYFTSNEPLVLIIHTHGTESFMPDGAKYYYDDGEIARSDDPDENMIAVGKEFVRVLEENGIKTVHCEIMHDKESYRDSYSRSAESIAKYLKQYPSIKYVFDLHRDSIMRSGGELISAVTAVNGKNHSQIMPVIGTGAADWEENMIFALKLRSLLNGDHTNLCRPICLRESTYNQNMAEISLLLEIGSSGNTLTEAKNAAILTAEAIVELIKSP